MNVGERESEGEMEGGRESGSAHKTNFTIKRQIPADGNNKVAEQQHEDGAAELEFMREDSYKNSSPPPPGLSYC